MATHCSTLAGKIPWTEKPGRLQSMGRAHNKKAAGELTAVAAEGGLRVGDPTSY